MKKHLFRTIGLLAVVAVALTSALPARAEDKPAKAEKAEKDKTHRYTGIIESMDAAAGTCTLKRSWKGKEDTKTFTCAPDCKKGEFKVGDKIVVVYTEEDGKASCHEMAAPKPKEPKEHKEKEEKKDK